MTSSCRNRYRRLTTNENGRSKLTEAYFKNQFREEGIDVSKIKPTPMKQPFTQKKKTHATIYRRTTRIHGGMEK